MSYVRAKKQLGQHFLTDMSVAEKVAGTLSLEGYDSVLEIGPGTGALTRFLMKRGISDLKAIEVDNESVEYLEQHFPSLTLIKADFLKWDIGSLFDGRFAITGNFPYHISSQIFFRVLEERERVMEVTGMLQKEVAERICAGPGSKTYGILSVLLQTFYNVEYLFTVPPEVFHPRPKVTSAVIRLKRNNVSDPGCDFKLMKRVIKATFNQRRKMVRNSVRSVFDTGDSTIDLLTRRPEQLSVAEFVRLTNWIEENAIL
ncbi:MAG: 16S rRNA (adenine(1518)-N(6)/adenine(1519)-N(6))-dimethyltransferase RsmA [Bacteroidia bacterium]|nr:MAG: 16S rRNA (adenine(1518)-N(6)/adenine(1519)-N(6))-dimethyltransferase RsmA [Bacteroidia bacterium]